LQTAGCIKNSQKKKKEEYEKALRFALRSKMAFPHTNKQTNRTMCVFRIYDYKF